ncbi:hypothetical protein A4G28_20620 [Mycobacterium ostraviense]|uniref:Uncharacterized protein n=1 Tax=Mycobacterium ostraviense TaxID=2738409 RepID=A0A164AGJ9_9MYCO|nr:hypothetical protein A4G28_20620 [Mycobacterium ostraviense]
MRVQPVGDRLGGRGHPRIAQPIEVRQVTTQLGVQRAPIRHVQTRTFPHDQGGPPFRQGAAFQRGQRVRHLVHQGLRKAEMPGAAGR